MWFSAIKLAVSAGSHIYKKKKETKMMMADAAAKTAQRMASGELEYSGKLLESRNSDWKDEFILILLSVPIVMLGWSVWSDNPVHMEKMELFFMHFGNLPLWYQTIFVGVIASVYGLKATHLIKGK
jgi:hypothetical protein